MDTLHCFIILIIGGCCLASKSSFEPKIIGGTPAAVGEFPYQVYLNIDSLLHCGGTLYSYTHVITAAHCVSLNGKVFKAASVEVRAGSINFKDRNIEIRKAKRIIIHENYDYKTIKNDIAIIEVSPAFSNTSSTISVCPLRRKYTAENTSCIVSGWGQTEGRYPENLLKVNVSIFNQAKCEQVYKNLITKDMVCAGDPKGGKDSCFGDSGGGLVCDGDLTGIVSFGSGVCGKPDYPAVYTLVNSFIDWIEKNDCANLQSSLLLLIISMSILLNRF